MDERELIWRTSSRSGTNGSCVEVANPANAWRKASRSGTNGGDCVEVASGPDRVLVRDSKDRHGPVLSVPPAEWRAFLSDLR